MRWWWGKKTMELQIKQFTQVWSKPCLYSNLESRLSKTVAHIAGWRIAHCRQQWTNHPTCESITRVDSLDLTGIFRCGHHHCCSQLSTAFPNSYDQCLHSLIDCGGSKYVYVCIRSILGALHWYSNKLPRHLSCWVICWCTHINWWNTYYWTHIITTVVPLQPHTWSMYHSLSTWEMKWVIQLVVTSICC